MGIFRQRSLFNLQSRDMLFLRRFLLALCAWEVCVLGSLALVGASAGNLTWGKDFVVFFAQLAVCGVFVVAGVAVFAMKLGRLGGATTGMLCGLAPSVLLFSWGMLARPGFEESPAAAGMAMILAAPSGVGGAIAGLICSWRTKNP